jgi:RNA-directed DNA polymerase
VNTDGLWPDRETARWQVLKIQTKLHQWATDAPDRRFDDLYNLVYDPAVLVTAWHRVRGNRGARSAGVDGHTAAYITNVRGEDRFLADLRADLKARTFRPLPVRERMIPKASGKIHNLASRSYEWVLEGDITACFDEIDHAALMGRVGDRIGDRRVLGLVKAFLKAGVLSEDAVERSTTTGTPQGGILSPLLANIALSVLDEHFAEAWQAMGATSSARSRRRHKGLATYRLVRYADDFVVLVSGNRAHVEGLRAETATVLAPMGLRLSETKTKIVHVDEGFDFLGFRIQRQPWRGMGKPTIYTFPTKAALASVKAKVRAATRGGTNQPLAALCRRLAPVLRGWTNYFRHGVSKRTFGYLRSFTWRRVVQWLRRKHSRATWQWLRRRYLPGWWPTEGQVSLFDPGSVTVSRYRYRGRNIPTPWAGVGTAA